MLRDSNVDSNVTDDVFLARCQIVLLLRGEEVVSVKEYFGERPFSVKSSSVTLKSDPWLLSLFLLCRTASGIFSSLLGMGQLMSKLSDLIISGESR